MSSDVHAKLESVLRQRTQIGDAIRERAVDYRGARRRQLVQLGHWFENPIRPDDVLASPDALAVCAPLIAELPSAAPDRSISEERIRRAASEGCDRLNEAMPRRASVVRVLIYPFMLLLMCWVLLVLFSVYLIPEFERMFLEFGLDVPESTDLVFWVAGVVRRTWPASLVFLVVAIAVAWVSPWITFQRRPPMNRRGWARRLVTSTRADWAQWAWHVALLIDAGFASPEAVAIAGYRDTHAVPTIDYAMQLPSAADQASLLHDVASNDWDRQRSYSGWWLSWLTPLVVWLVGMLVGFVVIALFGPLVSLISGLT